MMKKVIAIIGAGPGISASVALRFGKEGFSVALLSRTPEKLTKVVRELEKQHTKVGLYAVDAGDEVAITNTLKKVGQMLGPVQVIHYNAAVMKEKQILEETVDSLTEDFRINVAGVIPAVNATVASMVSGDGAVLLTGGGLAMNPAPLYGSLSLGKAGIRSLAMMLDEVLKPKGLYVGTVTITNGVSKSDAKYNPDAIAELFWNLYLKRTDREIVY